MFGFFKGVKNRADVYSVIEDATFSISGSRDSKRTRNLVDSVYNQVDDRQNAMYGKNTMSKYTKALGVVIQHVCIAAEKGDKSACNVFILLASEVGMMCDRNSLEFNAYDWNEYNNALDTLHNIQDALFNTVDNVS